MNDAQNFAPIQEAFRLHWNDERWHEFLRLTAGILEESQAESLIQWLMGLGGLREQYANFMLAAECLNEVRNRNSLAATDERVKTGGGMPAYLSGGVEAGARRCRVACS